MAAMQINLPESADRRLREEAAKRNASPEDFASMLLADRLRFDLPADSTIANGTDASARSFKDWLLNGPGLEGVDLSRDKSPSREIAL
jgi:hypothetical protein